MPDLAAALASLPVLGYVFQLIAFLPLLGLIAVFLPSVESRAPAVSAGE